MLDLKRLKEEVSIKNRQRKFELALSFIKENDTIIDIGVDPSLSGTTNYFEKWFTLPNKLTCLGMNADFSNFRKEFPNFELIEFDGEHYPVFEKKFDFAFCNAVIEHIGNFAKQVKWVSEIKKLTKLLFITTPNRWIPFETHSMTFFFHWFPLKMRNMIYRKIGKGHFANNYMWLLGERDFKRVIEESGFEIVSFYKNKFMFLTIDFVAVCKPGE